MNKVVQLMLALAILISSGNQVFGQTRTLQGKVSDSAGNPIPGVNILSKGANSGTTTNIDGEYSISVTDQTVLVFSFIGFSTQEIVVGNRSELSVVLREDAENLSEFVVTALGLTAEKEKLGYSVTRVDEDAFNVARETNVANSLAGRVAGLVVRGTSSGPGGTANVTLRGLPSISSPGAPLYVINGIPMDNTQRGASSQWGGGDNGDGIGNLSPDDIESMTVLKGQSASALYGTRAANGVIMITTKSVKKGSDWSLNYNVNYMAEQAMDFTNFQNQYGQGNLGQRPLTAADARATGQSSWGERMGGTVIGFDGVTRPYTASDERYIDFYNTGSNWFHSLSVAKGLGKDGAFRMSVSNLKSSSIVPNSGLNRFSINLNVDQNITSKLNVTAMVNYVDQRSDNVPFLSDGPKNPNNFLFLAPNLRPSMFAPGYDDQGKEVIWNNNIFVTNPYFIANKGINDLGRRRTISALSTKYSFTDKIYAMIRLGNDVSDDEFFSIDPYGLGYTQDQRGNLNSRGQSTRLELNLDGLFGARVNLTEDIELDALAGASLRKNRFESVSISGSRFVIPGLNSPFNVDVFGRGYDFREEQINSAFYSLGFGYRDLLTLTTTGRYDVYSTLPSDNRGIFTPSITGAFIFSNLLNMPALDFGKFRAGYAVTSGSASPYQTQLYFNSANSFAGVAAASSPLNLPNLFLKPFTLSEIEIGFDLSFFKGRLGLDLAYFDKTTNNEIMGANYSIASGFNSGVVGTGSTNNKGIEVLVNVVAMQKKDFEWRTSFNFTNVKNVVLSTDSRNNPIALGQNRATLGNAITAFVVGLPGPQIRAFDYQYNPDGSIKHNEQGLPLRGDLKDWGTTLPTVYGGWNNEFKYKAFSFSFLIDYSFGNKVLSATEFYAHRWGLHQNTLVGREGITNNGVTVAPQDYYRTLVQQVTRTSVVDGDFIKLRQLAFGYSFPRTWFNSFPILKGLDVSIVARNLAILMRKAENIDPENTFGSNVAYTGIEGTSLPSTRTIGFNLNFKLY